MLTICGMPMTPLRRIPCPGVHASKHSPRRRGALTAPAPSASTLRCTASQDRKQAFKSYKDYLGKDITSLVILPVWIMQPFTMLQNMAEIMEYTEALDKAAVTEDPYERCAWVCREDMPHPRLCKRDVAPTYDTPAL